jgi:hypothetical protein
VRFNVAPKALYHEYLAKVKRKFWLGNGKKVKGLTQAALRRVGIYAAAAEASLGWGGGGGRARAKAVASHRTPNTLLLMGRQGA